MRVIRRRADDTASALMLMPAAVLIVFVLGSIALDFSIIYLRQRQALNVAADAANDAVIEAIDIERFRADGGFVLDPHQLDAVAQRYTDVSTFGDDVRVDLAEGATPDQVIATVVVDYELVFVGVIPGADRHRSVTVHATAVAESPGP